MSRIIDVPTRKEIEKGDTVKDPDFLRDREDILAKLEKEYSREASPEDL